MKCIAFNIYLHVTNHGEFLKCLNQEQTKRYLKLYSYMRVNEIPFEVIKFNQKTEAFSFIESPDWDESYEPIVGDSHVFNKDGSTKIIKGGNRVYHRKHDFIDKLYPGFDWGESVKRTLLLEAIPEIKQNKSRIGNLKYWRDLLEKYGLPIYMDKQYNCD